MEFPVSQMLFSNSSYALEIAPSMNTVQQIKSAFTKHASGTLSTAPPSKLSLVWATPSLHGVAITFVIVEDSEAHEALLSNGKAKVQPCVSDN